MMMEENRCKRIKHKEWRKVARKERRKRLRRKAAAEREADEERLRAALEQSADYLNWRNQQEVEEKEKLAREKEEHDRLERLWLEEEVRSEKEWQVLQEKKQNSRRLQLEQEAKIREEFEAKQNAIRKKQEEERLRREEEIKKREQLFKDIDDYIDDGIKTPEALREIIDSQPGKEVCPFFTKTGACRYSDACSRNHRRVCLSKTILIPGFYAHFSLEKNSASEYDTDIGLEFEWSETRQHFREFYEDVIPELESFGRIKTLKCCCNTEIHLRGNLYVEYYTEREAARALRRLKGRWYAGRQLNCEFVNLKSWRSAVCGMSRCPKGRACNFLHTFKNPHDEYGIKSPPRWAKQSFSPLQEVTSASSRKRHKSKWEDISDTEDTESRHWRWSESPEPEVEHRSKNVEKLKDRRRSGERNSRSRRKSSSSRDKKRNESSDDLREGISDNRETRANLRNDSEKRKEDGNVSNGRRVESSSERRSKKRTRSKRKHSYEKHSNKKTRKEPRHESLEESKWDKEDYEEIDYQNTESLNSDVASVVEDKKILERSSRKLTDDEWATTDSED